MLTVTEVFKSGHDGVSIYGPGYGMYLYYDQMGIVISILKSNIVVDLHRNEEDE